MRRIIHGNSNDGFIADSSPVFHHVITSGADNAIISYTAILYNGDMDTGKKGWGQEVRDGAETEGGRGESREGGWGLERTE